MTNNKEINPFMMLAQAKGSLWLSFGLWALTLALLGCATDPTLSQKHYSAQLGFVERDLSTTSDTLTLYEQPADSQRLHIYLDGDGSPWVKNGRQIAANPTAREHLVLDLMKQDPNHTIYLARPCYSLEVMPTNCHFERWTQGRYSEQNVLSLLEAIVSIHKLHPTKSIWLFGYSGGGTLGQLIANRQAPITGLVTIAANLDIEAWTQWHGYLPLSKSLNPALEQPVLVPTYHLLGGQDRNIPEQLSANFRKTSQGISLLYPTYNHHCCWADDWSSQLKRFQAY